MPKTFALASIWKKELHPTGGGLSTEKRSIKELVGDVRRGGEGALFCLVVRLGVSASWFRASLAARANSREAQKAWRKSQLQPGCCFWRRQCLHLLASSPGWCASGLSPQGLSVSKPCYQCWTKDLQCKIGSKRNQNNRNSVCWSLCTSSKQFKILIELPP